MKSNISVVGPNNIHWFNT